MMGIDIEEVARFELDKESAFLKNNFSPEEISYAFSRTNPAMHLCGFFCVKEAVIKAIHDPVAMKDIQVGHEDGRPVVRLPGELNKKYVLAVSISHCDKYAVAVAQCN